MERSLFLFWQPSGVFKSCFAIRVSTIETTWRIRPMQRWIGLTINWRWAKFYRKLLNELFNKRIDPLFASKWYFRLSETLNASLSNEAWFAGLSGCPSVNLVKRQIIITLNKEITNGAYVLLLVNCSFTPSRPMLENAWLLLVASWQVLRQLCYDTCECHLYINW